MSIGNASGLFHRRRRLCPPAAHPPLASPHPAAGSRRPAGGAEAWGQAAGAAGAAKRDEREYLNIPIVAHPRVAQEKVAAVRAALLHMAHDPVGLQVLTASAALIRLDPPYGFVAATDSEYANIRTLFKHALVNRD